MKMFHSNVAEDFMEKKVVKVTCPGCGEEVSAVAWDGTITGLCTVSHKPVIIPEKEPEISKQVTRSNVQPIDSSLLLLLS